MKTTEIKIGEIFTVEKHMYIIGKPTTPSQDNENGHIIFSLIPIK